VNTKSFSLAHETLIGIDPGNSGGVAVLRDGQVTTFCLAKLTDQDLFRELAQLEPATVYLEKVGPTPQMGVTSAFTFGGNYRAVRMACVAAGLRLIDVTPQRWQSVLRLKKIAGGIGKNDTAKKNRNKAKAQELYPQLKITHAIADALLILEFGRMQ